MLHGGVCALAVGKATSEKAIANIRNKAIAIADSLLFAINFMLFFLLSFMRNFARFLFHPILFINFYKPRAKGFLLAEHPFRTFSIDCQKRTVE
jgi:hypothetical protein